MDPDIISGDRMIGLFLQVIVYFAELVVNILTTKGDQILLSPQAEFSFKWY